MDAHKRGVALWIAGGVMLIVGVGLCFAYLVTGSEGDKIIALIAVGAIVLAAGLAMMVAGYILGFKPQKELKENIQRYSGYPAANITDYRAELERVRANFAADGNPEKNKIKNAGFINSSQCYDFNAIKSGKIYYAHLIYAYPAIMSNQNMARMGMPAFVVYSPDPYFEENPLALREYAVKLYKNRSNNVLKNDANYFTNDRLAQVPQDREIYATTIMAYRPHLPLCCINDCLFPIIADPKNSTSAFIVDVKYWTEKLIGNYAHGRFNELGKRKASDPFEN